MKVGLHDKFVNLDSLLKEIAAELETMRIHFNSSKEGKDFHANISKGGIRKVSAQTEERYFERLNAYNNSEIITVRANHEKLLRIINEKYFPNGGNNCREINDRKINGEAHPLARLNCTCTENMDSLLQDVGLHRNLLSVGMPGDKVYATEEGYLLTYLHIFKNAVVSPDGDVYFLGRPCGTLAVYGGTRSAIMVIAAEEAGLWWGTGQNSGL